MKTIPHVLSAIALVTLFSSVNVFAASSEPPAPTPTQASAPAKAAPAKQPPRAPTLLAVTISEDDPDFAAGAAPAGLQVGATAASALDLAVVTKIQSAPLAQRETLITEIESRLNAAQQALAALRMRVSSSGQRNGSGFVAQQASTQARTCEQALRKSLGQARESKTAPAWTTARSALGRNYGDYAKAVAELEAALTKPVALTR
jgi:hypothetical protein